MFFLQESNITFEGIFLCPLYLAALHESEQEVVKFSNLPPKATLDILCAERSVQLTAMSGVILKTRDIISYLKEILAFLVIST